MGLNMDDGRIHNIVKIYPKEMSVYVPKVPIKRISVQNNSIPNKVRTPQDWTVDYIQSSIMRTHRTLKDYILCNQFTHFFTLTISGEHTDRYDDILVQTKISNWLNNIRRHSSLGYIVVPERHKDGALHFHGLMLNVETLNLYPTGRKDRSGRPRYNTDKYTLGFHDFTEIENLEAVSQYVRKYISKQFFDREQYKRRYWCSRNIKKPQKFHNVESIEELPLEALQSNDYGFYGRFSI